MTANLSRGQVGRGGNLRFCTFTWPGWTTIWNSKGKNMKLGPGGREYSSGGENVRIGSFVSTTTTTTTTTTTKSNITIKGGKVI